MSDQYGNNVDGEVWVPAHTGGGEVSETRTRRRIRKAVVSRGYAIKELEWEPVYNAGEMCGLAGGWYLQVDRPYVERTFPGDELGGLSAEELLADIDHDLRPAEPCECDRDHHAVMRAGRINDPQKTTHDADCKWHIPYKLRWWKDKPDE